MSWWRDDDPLNDENEYEIKLIFLLSSMAVMFAFMIMVIIGFSGCSHRFEDFKCKCNCQGKSTLECSTSELKTKVDGR